MGVLPLLFNQRMFMVMVMIMMVVMVMMVVAIVMMQVIEGHLTDHVVKEPEEAQREADLGVVLQVIKSYLK
ncbi:metal-sensitive transcriptional regulator [Enterobacter bugandensis]|uniref:hypothetical protein n=1 Tax=Enterobacter bugandensis TaxID=881260 RepID=UPI0028EA9140|nr:hypothetical protein [Enterobacter bugandensis]